MDLDEGLQAFVAEAGDLLSEMESSLLRLGQGADSEALIHAVFRAAHTIKGTAGLFSLDRIVEFTHAVEGVLDGVRDGRLALDAGLVGLLLSCADHIGAMVEDVARGGQGDLTALPDLAGRGQGLLGDLHGLLGQPARAVSTPSGEGACWHVSVQFGPDSFRQGMDPLAFIRDLGRLGELVAVRVVDDCLPAAGDFDAESCYLGFEIALRSAAGAAAIEQVFEFAGRHCTLQLLPPDASAHDFLRLAQHAPNHARAIADTLRATAHPVPPALASMAVPTAVTASAHRISAASPVDGSANSSSPPPAAKTIASAAVPGAVAPSLPPSAPLARSVATPTPSASSLPAPPDAWPETPSAYTPGGALREQVMPDALWTPDVPSSAAASGGVAAAASRAAAPGGTAAGDTPALGSPDSARVDAAWAAHAPHAHSAAPTIAPAALSAPAPPGEPRENRTIRVDADRLGHLITLVGELIIASARTSLAGSRLRDPELRDSTELLASLVEEVRDSALQLRMVRIGPTFRRFQRLVHDAARERNKEIRLEISGEEVELDKTLVERIADPLTHLVRNAIDHGIEPAAERIARGKPAQGTIALNAHHDAGTIVIEVSDDGGGLPREKILAKAATLGLATPGQRLSDSELQTLIFEPGFSTASEVTNLSGRGVGMDVVKKNIEALRGSIAIDSQEGAGTTVKVRLPLTLAIVDCLLVRIGGSSFALPLSMVEECVASSPEEAGGLHQLRGEVLPLIILRDLFRLSGPPPRRESIVVVRHAGQKAGLVVDALLGQVQAVMKPLSPLLAGVRCITGSTILGSGEVALVLDLPVLLKQNKETWPC